LNGDVMGIHHEGVVAQGGLISLVLTMAICFGWLASAIDIVPALK
jgi:hypothetical protein